MNEFRLIDADALLIKLDSELNADARYIDIADQIRDIINKAPTVSIDWGADNGDRTVYARPQGEWVPVSERLPDKNGECLVSLDFGDVNIDAFVDGIFVCYLGNVIAWQPLPEPYKEETKDDG